MQGVKHIIFDLGNVILNISYEETAAAFEKLGIADFKNIFSKQSQNTMADDIETGKVDEYTFIEYLKEKCNADWDSPVAVLSLPFLTS